MAALTQQRDTIKREIAQLQKGNMRQRTQEENIATAAVLTMQLCNTMPLRDLKEWKAQLQQEAKKLESETATT